MSDNAMRRRLMTLIGLGAILGKADTLFVGAVVATDVEVLSAMHEAVARDGPIFRGGQPHGKLRRDEVVEALESFMETEVDDLALAVLIVSLANDKNDRAVLVKDLFNRVAVAGRVFKGGAYWQKRFFELLLLAAQACQSEGVGHICDVKPTDIDGAAGLWPLGNGTKDGLQRLFPGLSSSMEDGRAAIRVVCRCLGGGKRQLAFHEVSALLCFWKRSNDGTLGWGDMS